jgi:hypothetical protein
LTEESLNSLTRENKQGTAFNHDKRKQTRHSINKEQGTASTRETTERNKGPLAGRHMVFLNV